VFILSMRRQPTPTLFPYTTLFRSVAKGELRMKRHLWSALALLATAWLAFGARPASAAPGCTNPYTGNCYCNASEAVTGFNGHVRSEEHTSELQSQSNLVCRLLLEK